MKRQRFDALWDRTPPAAQPQEEQAASSPAELLAAPPAADAEAAAAQDRAAPVPHVRRIPGVPHEVVPLEGGTVMVEVVEDPRVTGRWVLSISVQAHDSSAPEPRDEFLVTLAEAERLGHVLRRVAAKAAVALHLRANAGRTLH